MRYEVERIEAQAAINGAILSLVEKHADKRIVFTPDERSNMPDCGDVVYVITVGEYHDKPAVQVRKFSADDPEVVGEHTPYCVGCGVPYVSANDKGMCDGCFEDW